jgi:hypothetical protein
MFGLCAGNSGDGGRLSESSIVVRIVRFKAPLEGPGVRSRFRAKSQMAEPGIVATIDGKSSYPFRSIVNQARDISSSEERLS